MQIEEGVIRSPFFGDYPVLLTSFSVYHKLLPNLSTPAGYEAELAGNSSPFKNGNFLLKMELESEAFFLGIFH